MKTKIKSKLQGKRLLVLGGSLWKDAIQQIAKAYGITLIATGNDQSAGIFDIAHEKYSVDSTDINAMKELIRNKRIDGVYMGGSEKVISSACTYLNELNLPCYCTKRQWDFMQNKEAFKKLCVKHGLPVTKVYDIKEDNIIHSQIKFPVITKPADCCGSMGFSVCYDHRELKDGYLKAKIASESGNVLVEEFVNNRGVVVFYTICNGKLYFLGLEDKYPVCLKNHGSYVGGLFIFESLLTAQFRKLFEHKISMMVEDIGIKEGSFWIEVFHDGECFYFNEAGFRYGGSASIYPIDYVKGINQVAADIYFSLTGESMIDGFVSMIPDTVPRKKFYAIYPVYARSGKINNITIEEELSHHDSIVTFILKVNEKEFIPDTGTFSQAIALVHFVFDDESDIELLIDQIHDSFHVVDINGEEMTYRLLDETNFQL